MTVLWMLYAGAVSVALCVAAAAAERSLRVAELPARGAWLAALAGTVGLPLLALMGGTISPLSGLLDGGAAVGGQGLPAGSGLAELLAAASGASGAAGSAGESGSATSFLLDLAAGLEEPLLLGWAALTSFLGLRLTADWWRLRARRRDWHRERMDGREVLVARQAGPALSGFLRPEIVVPRWFSEIPAELRELALRHEEAHREARDPWLVLGAELLRTLLPWNPGLHWAASRLRRAAELDCDRRIVRGGADRSRYGRLLLTVGGRDGPAALSGGMALTERTSDLKRRLTMLRSSAVPWKGVRMAGAAALAVAAVAVACETPVPPAEDEAPTAEEAAVTSGEDALAPDGETGGTIMAAGRTTTLDLDSPDAPLVVIDGDVAQEPVALRTLDVASIEVIKGEAATAEYGDRAENGAIEITTKDGEGSTIRERTADKAWRIGAESDSLEFRDHDGSLRIEKATASSGESPLIVVDGVIMGRGADLERINEMDIARIEVVKGEAARALYGDRARDGLIQITTKGGG